MCVRLTGLRPQYAAFRAAAFEKWAPLLAAERAILACVSAHAWLRSFGPDGASPAYRLDASPAARPRLYHSQVDVRSIAGVSCCVAAFALWPRVVGAATGSRTTAAASASSPLRRAAAGPLVALAWLHTNVLVISRAEAAVRALLPVGTPFLPSRPSRALVYIAPAVCCCPLGAPLFAALQLFRLCLWAATACLHPTASLLSRAFPLPRFEPPLAGAALAFAADAAATAVAVAFALRCERRSLWAFASADPNDAPSNIQALRATAAALAGAASSVASRAAASAAAVTSSVAERVRRAARVHVVSVWRARAACGADAALVARFHAARDAGRARHLVVQCAAQLAMGAAVLLRSAAQGAPLGAAELATLLASSAAVAADAHNRAILPRMRVRACMAATTVLGVAAVRVARRAAMVTTPSPSRATLHPLHSFLVMAFLYVGVIVDGCGRMTASLGGELVPTRPWRVAVDISISAVVSLLPCRVAVVAPILFARCACVALLPTHGLWPLVLPFASRWLPSPAALHGAAALACGAAAMRAERRAFAEWGARDRLASKCE